jgi:hypothetical protein
VHVVPASRYYFLLHLNFDNVKICATKYVKSSLTINSYYQCNRSSFNFWDWKGNICNVNPKDLLHFVTKDDLVFTLKIIKREAQHPRKKQRIFLIWVDYNSWDLFSSFTSWSRLSLSEGSVVCVTDVSKIVVFFQFINYRINIKQSAGNSFYNVRKVFPYTALALLSSIYIILFQ